MLQAIANGKHVVTANKALLAKHGNEIFAAAQEKGVMVAFEAAVAGGIPIIKALREGLTANRIEWIAGIINGTTNFILSEMRDKGLSFEDGAARKRRRCGYAEADPTFDIEGIDAAHKLTIMSAIAFGIPMQFDKAYIEGITQPHARGHPLRRAAGLPHQAARHHQARPEGIELRVHPTLVPGEAPDRQRRGRDERGAGQGRRGRRDDVLRPGRGRRADGERGDRRPGRRHAHAHRRSRAPRTAPRLPARPAVRRAVPADGRASRRSYYLRMRVEDKPGVLADITRILADRGISIDAMIQREPAEGEAQTDIIMLTHLTHRRQHRRRHRGDRGAAHRRGQGHAHPPRGAGVGGVHVKYVSTRGAWAADPQPFTGILLEGLAPDGGLAVPQAYPRFSADELERLRPLDYPALAFAVLSRFFDDLPPQVLRQLIDATYTRATFGSDAITPLATLAPGLHLLEVSNGPTLAFKDIALQLLGRLFEHVLADGGRTLNILGATSGDTGSSAEHAMLGKRGVQVFMLSPHGRMSPFQQAQMYSLHDPERSTTSPSRARSTTARTS